MSIALQFKLTQIGQAALWNSSCSGIALNLTHVQFGSGNRAPDGSEIKLLNPQQSTAITTGFNVSPTQIRMSAIFSGNQSYPIREVGLWAGDPANSTSQLVGYWSQASGDLAYKSADVEFIFSHNLMLDSAVPNGSLVIASEMNQNSLLALIKQFVLSTPTILNVNLNPGPGEFARIQDAWDSLIGKTLAADVIIKVADGVYPVNAIYLSKQPFAERIRIEGNLSNPQNCILQFIPIDDKKAAYGVTFANVRGCTFSGFTLRGTTDDTCYTYRGLQITEGAWVSSASASIRIENCGRGLEVFAQAKYLAPNLSISNHTDWAVYVGSGSSAHLDRIRVSGRGKNSVYLLPQNSSSGWNSSSTETPHGILADDTSKLYAKSASISAVRTGVQATRNAYLSCASSTVSDCVRAFYADYGGTVFATASSASNCTYGFLVSVDGLLLGNETNATDCTGGYRADHHAFGNFGNAKASNCETGFWAGNSAEAYVRGSTATNCPTPYSPAIDATTMVGIGNNNGLVCSTG